MENQTHNLNPKRAKWYNLPLTKNNLIDVLQELIPEQIEPWFYGAQVYQELCDLDLIIPWVTYIRLMHVWSVDPYLSVDQNYNLIDEEWNTFPTINLEDYPEWRAIDGLKTI